MVVSFQCSKHDISGDENSTHAMAARYGQLQEFKPGSDSINAYLERVSLYFAANDVADGKKVPVLLSSIGAPIYAVLSDLLAPEKPGDKSFDAISTALCNHFEPKRSGVIIIRNGTEPERNVPWHYFPERNTYKMYT